MIFSYLDTATLLACRQVCRHWSELILDNFLPERLTLAVWKPGEDGEDIPAVQLAEVDKRLWRNVSFHCSAGLKTFFWKLARLNPKWAEVRKLDITVGNEQAVLAFQQGIVEKDQ